MNRKTPALAMILAAAFPAQALAGQLFPYVEQYSPEDATVSIEPPLTCEDDIEIRATFGRKSLSVHGSPCVFTKDQRQLAGKLRATVDWGSEEGGPFVLLTVTSTKLTTGLRSVKYRISRNGERLGSGTMRFDTRRVPLRTIWEETDAFVNVCINESKRIEKEHGRLYCLVGGFTEITTTVRPTVGRAKSVTGHLY
jgi:hypothetical protein